MALIYQFRYKYDAGGDKICVDSWLEIDLIQLVYDALYLDCNAI